MVVLDFSRVFSISVNISNPDFWLDEIMKAGANDIHVFNIE